jgi:hypothetical protein
MRQRRLNNYKRTAPPPVTDGWTTKHPGSSEEELWHWIQLRGGPVESHQLMDFDWHKSTSEQMEAHRKSCPELRSIEYKLPRYIQRMLDIEHADEDIANEFHEAYEILAPRMGVHSRVEQARAWNDLPLKNRNAMIAAFQHLLRHGLIVPGPAFGASDAPEVSDVLGAPRVVRHSISPPRDISTYGEVVHHGLGTYNVYIEVLNQDHEDITLKASWNIIDKNSIKFFPMGHAISQIRIIG